MSIIQAKVDYSKNGPNDEYYTPEEAVEMILPFIPPNIKIIWECTAVKGSKIVSVLEKNGYKVISTHIADGFDFLLYEPDVYEIIITNPPYSLKDEFLQRAYNLGKPFLFLLPITSLEGMKRHKLYRNYGIQLIIPDRRFVFKQGGSGSWVQTSWFAYGLNLKNDLNFVPIKNSNLSLEIPLNERHLIRKAA